MCYWDISLCFAWPCRVRMLHMGACTAPWFIKPYTVCPYLQADAGFIKPLMTERRRHVLCVGDGWNWPHAIKPKDWTHFRLKHWAKGAVKTTVKTCKYLCRNAFYNVSEWKEKKSLNQSKLEIKLLNEVLNICNFFIVLLFYYFTYNYTHTTFKT